MTDPGHCQCLSSPGNECHRIPTAEDLLCDLCRMTRADPDLICFTIAKDGQRLHPGHGQTNQVTGTGVFN